MNLVTIGRYEIKRELGRGGMATVYHAFDPSFGREVAIKVLPREFLHDPDFRKRFQREARIIAALEYPSIVPVYDFGEENEQPYIVMRLMTGGSLTDRLQQGGLPVPQVIDIMERLARALDRAHARGIVHRDLKPANILLDDEGEPYISDFGIAKMTAESSTFSKTAIIGTPAYMSPEQWYGEDLDGRSDVYAIGIILFEMLAGKLPYEGNTPPAFMTKHLTEPVPSLLDVNPSLTYSLQMVIEKAMAKKREDRFRTAGEMVTSLKEAAQISPIETPKIEIKSPAVSRPTDLSFEQSYRAGKLIGWFNSYGFVSNVSTEYQFHVIPRPDASDGACLLMRHRKATSNEFGSLMQRCPASHLRETRIRFEGQLATEVEDWAGLWLRVDGDNGMLFFDNMSDRPVRSVTGWSRYSIETILPPATVWLNYGILMVGRGTLWADNFRLLVESETGGWIDIGDLSTK
jgi:serine/threonine-protein kinase